MPNGWTCKKVSRCSKGSCTVKNDQCGGASSLRVKISDKAKSKTCKVGIREIRFSCGTKTNLPTTTTTTPACTGGYCPKTSTPCKGNGCGEKPGKTTSTSSSSTSTTPKPCNGGYCNPETHDTNTTPTNSYPGKTTPTSTPTTSKRTFQSSSTPDTPKQTTPSSTPTTNTNTPKTYPKETTPTSTPTTTHPYHSASTSSAPHPSGCTGKECAPPTAPACQYNVNCKTPGLPSTKLPSASFPSTPVRSTRSTSCIGIGCGNSSKPPSGSTKSVATTSSGAPPKPTSSQYPPVDYPPTLPRCLKTWIFIISCTDTANTACFCLEAEFIMKVSDCVQSWGKDTRDIAKSLEILMGLCQPFIPKNPAIVTCIPPDMTLPVPTVSVPVTTIVQTITTVVPCTTTPVRGPKVSSAPVYSNASMTTETKTVTLTIPKVTLVTKTNDVTLVYPTSPGSPLGPPPPPDVPTTFNTGVATPGPPYIRTKPDTGAATPTGSGSSIPTITSYPGAAAGLYPATFVAVVGALLAAAFQL